MIAEMKPWYDNYCFARMSLNDDRVFKCHDSLLLKLASSKASLS